MAVMGLFTVSAMGFTVPDIGFPFKNFVYQGARVPAAEIKDIEVLTNTPYYYAFNFKGTNYQAELFVYGAIYLKRQHQNPMLLSFDIREYRLDGRFRP